MFVNVNRKSYLTTVLSADYEYYFDLTNGNYALLNDTFDLMRLNYNTYYILDSFTVSGTITEDVFVKSINDKIKIEIFLKSNRERVLSRAWEISNYYGFVSVPNFVIVNRNYEYLQVRMVGRLRQVSETVGVERIKLRLGFVFAEVQGTEFQKEIRDVERL